MNTMRKEQNVVQLPLTFINKYYEEFLNGYSVTTAINYKSDIELFFSEVIKKEPKHVTIEDIEAITSLDATRYHTFLKTIGNKGKPYKNASIKRKINSIRSFYNFLLPDFKNINIHVFNNLNLESPDLDSESYGVLPWDDTLNLCYLALERQIEGNQLGMLFKLGAVTSIRLTALLSLNWEQHFKKDKSGQTIINYIDVIDKKQRHIKSISDELYNELQTLLGNTGKLFPNLHAHKVGKEMKKILKDLGYDESDNIKFHSIKGAGVIRTFEKNGSLLLAKEQGNHKSSATTEKHYLKFKRDLTAMASYTLDKDEDVIGEIAEFSSNEILKALNDVSDSMKYELLRVLKEKNQ